MVPVRRVLIRRWNYKRKESKKKKRKKISAGLWKQNIAYQLAGWMASLTICRLQRGSQSGV
jgi:hypothetical protein